MDRATHAPARTCAAGEPRDVLVTGLPRGGTTLVARLLGELPGTVALDEPMDARTFMTGGTDDELVDGIAEFLRTQRRSLAERGTAISLQTGGTIADNRVGAARDANGRRVRNGGARGEIRVDKPLPRDFVLVMKHNGPFAALIGPLCARFETFAVVRNPLAVLASWNTVSLPVGRGHVPTAEAIDARLGAELAATPDVVARQIRILDWFCARFRAAVPAERVIRYEDVVATGGASLCVVSPHAASLSETLSSRNHNELYDPGEMREVGRRLLDTDGAYWHFYSRESVEELIP